MRYPNGLPGWADVSTTDVEAARVFYESLFGWTSKDMDTPMGVAYTQFFKGDDVVAGMGPLPPAHAEHGVPSSWNTFIIVEDADATVAAVTAAGGRVLMAPDDIMTQGRMAVIADPSGAALGLWQPIDHQGAAVFNDPDTMTWNELQTRDLDAAKPFYEAVFGWAWEELSGGMNGYFVASLDTKPGDDKMVAGAMATPSEVPAEVPNLWLTYFAVTDCDTAVAKAEELGATVFMPPADMGPGRYAGLQDPTGAMVMIGHSTQPS